MSTGRVVSVNLAVVRTDEWTRVKSGRSGIDKRPVDRPVFVSPSGVDGDTICDTKHHGGPDQAVYAYSTDDLAFWAAELGQRMAPGGVGENLTLDGVDCSGALIGERWRIGGAELRVRGPRIPCRVFAGFRGVPDLIPRFLAAGRPGTYLAVDRPGELRTGDDVLVLERPGHGVSVADLMAVRSGDRALLDHVATARDDLSAEGRRWVERLLAGRQRAAG